MNEISGRDFRVSLRESVSSHGRDTLLESNSSREDPGTITFIESLRTKEEKVRNILNLETCISVIAAFFYGKFVKDLDKGIDYKKINETRYVDWAITTPIMLLVLILEFLFNNN